MQEQDLNAGAVIFDDAVILLYQTQRKRRTGLPRDRGCPWHGTNSENKSIYAGTMASRMQVHGGAEIRIDDSILYYIIRTVELALPIHLRPEYKAAFNKHTRHLKASGVDGEGDGINRMDQNKHRRLSHMSIYLGLETLATRVKNGTLVKNINRWYKKMAIEGSLYSSTRRAQIGDRQCTRTDTA